MTYNFQYPSFLRSSRPYPKWHRVVHHSYLAVMVILVILLSLLHGYRIRNFDSATIFTAIALMLALYVLYWLWIRFWYQRNYQHPLFSLPMPASASSDPITSATQHSYPTFASLRNHAVATHIPLALRVGDAIVHPVPPIPPVLPRSPPPIYNTGVPGVGAPPPYEDGAKVREGGSRSASGRTAEEIEVHAGGNSVAGGENMAMVASRSDTYHDERSGRSDQEVQSGNIEES